MKNNLNELDKQLNELLEQEVKTTEQKTKAEERFAEILENYSDQIGDGAVFQRLQEAAAKLERKIAATESNVPTPAQKNLDAANKKFNDNLDANLFNDALNKFYGNKDRNSMEAFSAYGNSGRIGIKSHRENGKIVQDPTYNPMKEAGARAVEQGIKDGSIRNSRQAHDVQMAAERAYRDYASSKEGRQEERDRKRLEDLNNKDKKGRLSDKEKDERKQLQDMQDKKDEARKNLDAAQKAKDEEAQNIAKMKDTLEQIKTKMDNLGLK